MAGSMDILAIELERAFSAAATRAAEAYNKAEPNVTTPEQRIEQRKRADTFHLCTALAQDMRALASPHKGGGNAG